MKNDGGPRPAAVQKLGLRYDRTRRLPGYRLYGVYVAFLGGLDLCRQALCATWLRLVWRFPWSVGAACMRPANRAALPVAGRVWCLFCIVGRERPCFPQTPREAHPCREACMPPLQTPGSAYTNREPTGNGRRMGKGNVCCKRPLLLFVAPRATP